MSEQSMWPDGRESAACFTFDLDGEEVWIADMQAARRPGVLSQGTYGPKVAVPLILDILRRHQVAATFFVPGRVAERHPGAVRAILADRHEVGHHRYTHRSPADLSAAEEASELVAGRLPLLDELIGATVADSSVWVARADDIAARAAELHQAGPDRARSGRTS
jgi:hypothetical protein